MRYDIAIGLASAAILAAGWVWRRHRLAPAAAALGPPAARFPVATTRRRPF